MEVRVLVELADQRPPRLTGSEPREGVRSIAPVPGEHEFPPGKPAQQHAQKLPHQVARRLVTASSLLALFGSPVQRAQHRQRPGAVQARQSHLDRQHDPTSLRPVPVSPLPRCVRVRGTDGVAMPALAVDLLPRMLRDGVVAADRDRAARNETIDDASRENPRQPPRRPAPLREHAVIARPMAFGQRPGDPYDGVRPRSDRDSRLKASPGRQWDQLIHAATAKAQKVQRHKAESEAEKLVGQRLATVICGNSA